MSVFQNKKTVLIILAIVLLVLNVYGFYWVHSYIQDQADLRLHEATEDLEDKIKDRIAIYDDMLYGAAALFAASTEVTREEWRHYMNGTQFSKRYPGLETFSYIPVVKPDELALFEQVESSKLPGYKVFPATQTEIYAPILFVEPLTEGSLKARGFNVYSDPIRKQALDYARDTGKVAVTHKLTLVQDSTDSSAFILCLPIYRNGSDASTVENRRANLIGFVSGALRSEKFMQDVLVNSAPELKFQIFDSASGEEISASNLIYNSGDDSLVQPGKISDFTKHGQIDWPNTSWHIRYVADTKFGLSTLEQWLPYIMAARNLVLSIGVFLLIYILLNRYHKEAKRADSAEDRLAAEDAVVDAMDEAVITTNIHGTILVANKKAEQILGYQDRELINLKNITEIIDPGKLRARAEQVASELGTPVEPGFDAIITKSLIDGQDEVSLIFLSKDHMTLGITCNIRPLYGKANEPLGYQFTFK